MKTKFQTFFLFFRQVTAVSLIKKKIKKKQPVLESKLLISGNPNRYLTTHFTRLLLYIYLYIAEGLVWDDIETQNYPLYIPT